MVNEIGRRPGEYIRLKNKITMTELASLANMGYWNFSRNYVKPIQKMMYKKDAEIGKESFKKIKDHTEKNRSPTKKETSKDELETQIEFCYKELKIHRENQNNIMIAYKIHEIEHLEKKLK